MMILYVQELYVQYLQKFPNPVLLQHKLFRAFLPVRVLDSQCQPPGYLIPVISAHGNDHSTERAHADVATGFISPLRHGKSLLEPILGGVHVGQPPRGPLAAGVQTQPLLHQRDGILYATNLVEKVGVMEIVEIMLDQFPAALGEFPIQQ